MRPLVLLLASTLAYADVPLRSDTPPTEPTAPAPEAPLPEPPSPNTPSGTSTPPIDIVKPAPVIVAPPPPPRIPERRRPNVAFLSEGAALLVGGYVSDVGFTYGYDHHPASTSLIPIAGPWIQLGQRYGLDGPPINTGSASADANAQHTVDIANRTIRGLAFTGEIASGLLQAAGLALLIAGAITKGKPRVYRDPRGVAHISAPPPLRPNGSLLFTF